MNNHLQTRAPLPFRALSAIALAALLLVANAEGELRFVALTLQ